MTLVELIVAMGIFTVVIGVFLSGLTVMTRDTVRSAVVADSGDAVRRAFQRMDKQVRYASAVNAPVRVGDTWYVEFLTTAVPGGAVPTCTQWRLDGVADLLQTRSWPASATTVSSVAFTTIASGVSNDPTTAPPFAFYFADATYAKQRLDMLLDVRGVGSAGAGMRSSFVARNSGADSITNYGGTVCAPSGGRP